MASANGTILGTMDTWEPANVIQASLALLVSLLKVSTFALLLPQFVSLPVKSHVPFLLPRRLDVV